MRIRLSHKLSILGFLIITFVMSAISPLFIYLSKKELNKQHTRQKNIEEKWIETGVKSFFTTLSRDILFLKKNQNIKEIIRAISNGTLDSLDNSSIKNWQNNLQNVFKGYLKLSG